MVIFNDFNELLIGIFSSIGLESVLWDVISDYLWEWSALEALLSLIISFSFASKALPLAGLFPLSLLSLSKWFSSVAGCLFLFWVAAGHLISLMVSIIPGSPESAAEAGTRRTSCSRIIQGCCNFHRGGMRFRRSSLVAGSPRWRRCWPGEGRTALWEMASYWTDCKGTPRALPVPLGIALRWRRGLSLRGTPASLVLRVEARYRKNSSVWFSCMVGAVPLVVGEPYESWDGVCLDGFGLAGFFCVEEAEDAWES